MPFTNSFMKPVIERGHYFQVNTSAGTEFVPADVVGYATELPVSELKQYLEGKPDDADEVCHVQSGVLARMKAPGYTDCTDWCAYQTHDEALAALEDMYGDNE